MATVISRETEKSMVDLISKPKYFFPGNQLGFNCLSSSDSMIIWLNEVKMPFIELTRLVKLQVFLMMRIAELVIGLSYLYRQSVSSPCKVLHCQSMTEDYDDCSVTDLMTLVRCSQSVNLFKFSL